MTPGGGKTSFRGAMGPKTYNGAVYARSARSITHAEGSPRVGYAKKEHAARSAAPKKEKKTRRRRGWGVVLVTY